MTKPPFKKGDLVTIITDWDRKGTVAYHHGIVYSCGLKRMIITDAETGEELKKDFTPIVGSLQGTETRYPGGVFPRMTDAEATECCLSMGAIIVERELARHQKQIENSTNPHYKAAMQSEIDKLHEPRAILYQLKRHY